MGKEDGGVHILVQMMMMMMVMTTRTARTTETEIPNMWRSQVCGVTHNSQFTIHNSLTQPFHP